MSLATRIDKLESRVKACQERDDEITSLIDEMCSYPGGREQVEQMIEQMELEIAARERSVPSTD